MVPHLARLDGGSVLQVPADARRRGYVSPTAYVPCDAQLHYEAPAPARSTSLPSRRLSHCGERRCPVGDSEAMPTRQRLHSRQLARARVGYDAANGAALSPMQPPKLHERHWVGGNSCHAATLRATLATVSRMYSDRVRPRREAAMRSAAFSSVETRRRMFSIIAIRRRMLLSRLLGRQSTRVRTCLRSVSSAMCGIIRMGGYGPNKRHVNNSRLEFERKGK